MPRDNENEFLRWALRDNEAAVEMCRSIFRISQVWDDLVDKDREVPGEEVSAAFWEALVNLPANPFYRQFEQHLRPLLIQYMTDFEDSARLETEDDHGRNISFVLRDSVGSIVSQCAFLVGGREWLRMVSPEVRRHIHEDPLEEYKKGVGL